MKPNAKIKNANTGAAFSAARYDASSVVLSERGERLKVNRVVFAPRYNQVAMP